MTKKEKPELSPFAQLCVDLEHFETPQWAVRVILQREILTRAVWDPCAGSGILGRAAREAGYCVVSTDIRDWEKPYKGAVLIHDFLEGAPINLPLTFDNETFTVLMNPPFSKAEQFVERAFALGARKVLCFQRFAWWESQARKDFWQKYPPNRIYICGDRATCWRHDLTETERRAMKGSTPTAHAWFVWEKGLPAGTLVGHIYKSEAASL